MERLQRCSIRIIINSTLKICPENNLTSCGWVFSEKEKFTLQFFFLQHILQRKVISGIVYVIWVAQNPFVCPSTKSFTNPFTSFQSEIFREIKI